MACEDELSRVPAPPVGLDEGDDAPLYPLIRHTAALVGTAVAVRLEFATSEAEYEARSGAFEQVVMTPQAAITLGQILIEQGRRAAGQAH